MHVFCVGELWVVSNLIVFAWDLELKLKTTTRSWLDNKKSYNTRSLCSTHKNLLNFNIYLFSIYKANKQKHLFSSLSLTSTT
jgi:hypothetical protein